MRIILFLTLLATSVLGQTEGTACDNSFSIFSGNCDDDLFCNFDTETTDSVGTTSLTGTCTACPTDCSSSSTVSSAYPQAMYACSDSCGGATVCSDTDTAIDALDTNGNSCYNYDPTMTSTVLVCGTAENSPDFVSTTMCCACGGGVDSEQSGVCYPLDSTSDYLCGSSYTDLCYEADGTLTCVNKDNFWVEIDCSTCSTGSMKGGAIALIVCLVLFGVGCFCVLPILCCCGVFASCGIMAAKGSSDTAGTTDASV